MKEPKVHVGILSGQKIEFTLLNTYRMNGAEVSGKQTSLFDDGKILWRNHHYEELLFEPLYEATDSFELQDVTIGINFHWERKENQRFQGALKIIIENNTLTGINRVNVEDYLVSVISSEMSANASLELLKAHAVISRSWLLNKLTMDSRQLTGDNGQLTVTMQHDSAANCQLSTVNCQLIKWYDQEDHTHFDVCADDHCQRYQGITRASTEIVKEAIHATRGQVLTYNGQICDARFSKCCGGAFEEFQYCWEDVKHPYLVKQRDSKTTAFLPDLRMETEAEKWIRSSPEAFCNTTENKILSQVLNNYDQETTDFYRWKVFYKQEELAELIHRKSGIDFGQILDLVPVNRGTSGRIEMLKIVGTHRTFTIGKELEIRRTLSKTHLYSSAFVVDKEDIQFDIPGRFVLTGAGWGHGVGLCQIGAAMMAGEGYDYRQILSHYFSGASIEKRY